LPAKRASHGSGRKPILISSIPPRTSDWPEDQQDDDQRAEGEDPNSRTGRRVYDDGPGADADAD
jgi:hypothetical protein